MIIASYAPIIAMSCTFQRHSNFDCILSNNKYGDLK